MARYNGNFGRNLTKKLNVCYVPYNNSSLLIFVNNLLMIKLVITIKYYVLWANIKRISYNKILQTN